MIKVHGSGRQECRLVKLGSALQPRCVVPEENCSKSKLQCHLLRFIKITISVAIGKRYFCLAYFVWGCCVADKSDLSSPLPATSVSCSVLFPLKKEGSESLVLPHWMLFRPAPQLLAGLFGFFCQKLYIKQLSYMVLMVVTALLYAN